MLGSVFERCRMRPLTLDEVDFTLAVLGGNDLRGVDLSGVGCARPAWCKPICAKRCCAAPT
jgi:uncharacterized protein YjbI with pentapeptide repeats